MWLAMIVITQTLAASPAGGEEDFKLCNTGGREQSIAACQRVGDARILDAKSVGRAFVMLARWANDPNNAIPYLQKAIEAEPENGDTYGELGFQHHLLGDYDRALASYEAGLERKPDSTYTLLVRALTWTNKGDGTRALADLDRAIAIEPKVVFYKVKAETLLRQGRNAEALATVEEGLKQDPKYTDLLYARAEIHRKTGDAAGELAALDRMLELVPHHIPALICRALLHERMSKPDRAIADYDALIALQPGEKFYADRRAELSQGKASGAAVPAPQVVDEPPAAPSKVKRGAADARPARDCRVYIAAAALTVSVPCGK